LHDTVWFEIQGKPAVSIASSEFVDAAETQAKALGMDGARRLFVAHPIQDATDDEMRAKADGVIDAVIDALTRND
jgi:alkanesulfonate monooxygenase SsuD/methylene tetrahydromethanopterin reductase-like flavin-dependent oxidoreductase (luciferase family)